jgi:uncharacterized membrane protein
MVPLTLGILAGLGLLVLLAQIADPVAQATRVRRVAELLVATVVLMIITRHQVRGFYLESHRAGEQLVVATQWGVLALFLVVFVVCVGLTVYAVMRAIKDRPAPGEQAA